MAEPEATNGQATGTPQGTTQTAPEGESGQSVSTGQTTGSGPDTTAEDSFFDPSTIKGTPLEAAYKQMQGAWTKAMQKTKANQHMVEAYQNFERNPQATLQQLAQAYGFQLVQHGQSNGQNGNNENWEPKTWDEVKTTLKGEAKTELLKELQPVLKPMFDEVKGLRKLNVEKSLDELDPQWRLYEDDMLRTLEEHPTLVKDPQKLYRMSVPEEVVTAKITKEVLAKINGKSKSAQVSGGSTTTQKPSQVQRASNFQEAVEIAQKRLAEQGLRRPGA